MSVLVANESFVVDSFATANRSAVLPLLVRKRSSQSVVAQLAANHTRPKKQKREPHPPTDSQAPLQLTEKRIKMTFERNLGIFFQRSTTSDHPTEVFSGVQNPIGHRLTEIREK